MTEFLQEPETFYQPSLDELIRFAEEAGYHGGEVLVPLAGGHHNAVYRYGDIVIRHPKTQSAVGAIEAEFALLQELDGLRMPRALGYGEIAGTPVALIEFVDGVHKDFNELNPEQVEELARAMADLHSVVSDRFSDVSGGTPVQEGTHADYLLAMVRESVTDRFERMEADGRDLSRYGDAEQILHKGMEELSRLLAEHADEFDGRTFNLLHHDLNPKNVLWRPDGSVVFIDCNPTYGDPCDDVNYAVANNQGSADFQRLLLDAYARAANCRRISPARMKVYTLKNWLDDLVWTIEMCECYSCDSEYADAYAHRVMALRHLLQMAD